MPLAAAGLLLALGGCSQGGKMVLRLKLKEGESYVFSNSITQTNDSSMGKAVIEQSLVTTIQVTEAKDGKYTSTSTLSDVKVDVKEGGGAMAQAAQMAENLEGTKVTMRYDDKGRTIEAEGKEGAAGNLAAGTGVQGIGFLGVHYPDHAVGPGDSWEATYDLKSVLGEMGSNLEAKGPTSIPVKYKLQSVAQEGGKKVATIEFSMNGKLAFTIKGAPGSSGEVGIDTSATGTIKVDTATGLPLEAVTKGNNQVQAGGIEVKQLMDVKMSLKR
jgi:hypothetical protein